MKWLTLLLLSSFLLFSCQSKRFDASLEDQVILEFAKKLEEEEVQYKHTYEQEQGKSKETKAPQSTL